MPGFQPVDYPVTVDAALPLDITLRLTLRTAVDVIVGHQLEPDSPATRASIAGESIARIPVRTMASGVQEAVATLPGWATEDNGLLHVRGVDDGFLYVIDGVPVYERLDPLNGMGPPLANIESINVITGYIPAEFGHKAGGVIDVRSKSIGKDWLGTVAGRTRQRRRDRRFRAGRVAILPCPRDDPRGERAAVGSVPGSDSSGQLPQPRRARQRRKPVDVVGIGLGRRDRQRRIRRDGLRRSEQRPAGDRVAGSAPADQAGLRDAVVATRILIVDLFAARGVHAPIEGGPCRQRGRHAARSPSPTAAWFAAA